jgi:hypothetical protein
MQEQNYVAVRRQNWNTLRIAPDTPAGSARSSSVFAATSRVHPDAVLVLLTVRYHCTRKIALDAFGCQNVVKLSIWNRRFGTTFLSISPKKSAKRSALVLFFKRSQNCEKRQLASSCLYVRIEWLGGSHWTDFHEISYLRIFRKFVEKI